VTISALTCEHASLCHTDETRPFNRCTWVWPPLWCVALLAWGGLVLGWCNELASAQAGWRLRRHAAFGGSALDQGTGAKIMD
jgi:hypothetical protein